MMVTGKLGNENKERGEDYWEKVIIFVMVKKHKLIEFI